MKLTVIDYLPVPISISTVEEYGTPSDHDMCRGHIFMDELPKYVDKYRRKLEVCY